MYLYDSSPSAQDQTLLMNTQTRECFDASFSSLRVVFFPQMYVSIGCDPVRGTAVLPGKSPAANGVSTVFSVRRDRGGERGLFPRAREGYYLAHMRQV